MKRLIFGLLLLFMIHSSEAQVSFDTLGHTLNINEWKVQRLTDGAPATIIKESWDGNKVSIQLYEGGSFKAYSKTKPKKVLVNGKEQTFSYTNSVLSVDTPVASKPTVTICW